MDPTTTQPSYHSAIPAFLISITRDHGSCGMPPTTKFSINWIRSFHCCITVKIALSTHGHDHLWPETTRGDESPINLDQATWILMSIEWLKLKPQSPSSSAFLNNFAHLFGSEGAVNIGFRPHQTGSFLDNDIPSPNLQEDIKCSARLTL